MHRPRIPSLTGSVCAVAAMLLVLLAGSFSEAAKGSTPSALFSAPGKKAEQAVLPRSRFVLRQRAATVHLNALPVARGGQARTRGSLHPFTLNLFNGVSYVAQPESLMQAGNFTVLTGKIEGHESSRVTLAYGNGILNGAIRVAQSYFQVRSFDKGLQIIREIDVQALPAAAGCTGQLGAEQSVVTLVNEERAIEGVAALECNDSLSQAARNHSADMAEQNYFSHVSKDGRTFVQRILASGYSCSAAGENIAEGYSSADAVMQGWMSSSGHRANILNPGYCDIGVGYATHVNSGNVPFWTQDFARRAGVSQCSTSPGPQPSTVSVSGHVTAQSGQAMFGVTIVFGSSGESVTTNVSGYFAHDVSKGWSGKVTPSKTGYTFLPAYRNLSNVTADMAGQDFIGNPVEAEKPVNGFVPGMLPLLLE